MSLDIDEAADRPLWPLLPEHTRVETLAVLAGMIAGGMIACEELDAADAEVGEARS